MLQFMPDMAKYVSGETKFDDKISRYGMERVEAAIEGLYPGMTQYNEWCKNKSLYKIIKGVDYSNIGDAVKSFICGIIICRKLRNPKLLNKFAYVEAAYAQHMLNATPFKRKIVKSSAMYSSNNMGGHTVADVCREIMGFVPEEDGERFSIPVNIYLPLAIQLGKKWKLINQDMTNGIILLPRYGITRLLRDAIVLYIVKKAKKMETIADIPVKISDNIYKWCEENTIRTEVQDMPPCVQYCVRDLESGKNVSHSGRFLTATFLLNSGEDQDKVHDIFANAPDYNERITRYHIQHIKNNGYNIPSCKWVKSNHLCPGCTASHPGAYKNPNKTKNK